MSVLHSIRKLCPVCGRTMKLVPNETDEDHYVCPRCDGDPLHNQIAHNWANSPLKPPTEV